ncbi:hypothetical protein GCM10010260_37870 [Streptomyces filipinensis]|uniref:Uncharacterized protein n=1 Tax=Streptomyces filipinensis TaxID=66887 RepID=A0A918MCB2_9ACTN|nr:hypothetical protein [Streptomyces filipinensis]GGU98143.1 hypothetical protein GCM10010260_37870 [Streptomyces filipinensis]
MSGHSGGPAAAPARAGEAWTGRAPHLFPATRAPLPRDHGRDRETAEADRQVLRLTDGPGERSPLAAPLRVRGNGGKAEGT